MSQAYLFDTNVLIYLLDGEDERILEFIESIPREDRYISSITRHEVMIGKPDARERDIFSDEDNQVFNAINDNFTTVPMSPRIERLAAQRRRQNGGRAPDAIIAATGLELQAIIVTRNVKDFKNYPFGVHPI
ncbi:type II toxin-antitoxin system VapC family toxin [Vogesella amnigena]|uniref:Ribonuclease VapC n=1 Tax=Vogesella amnigena TaxID=1507449 RepID=A0ABV7TR01_9NEIS